MLRRTVNTDVGTKCSRTVRELFELIQQSSPGERAGEDLELSLIHI